MDFIVLATLEGETVIAVTISYDVGCQWQILLPGRAEVIRTRGATSTNLAEFEMQFALPVWHAAAHEEACRAANSLSYAIGVGKTDGEGIERTWSLLNPISWATKEMGEGARHDVLEDKIDHINWEKNINFGRSLHRKLIIAVDEAATQEKEFKELSLTVPKAVRERWHAMEKAYALDKTLENPRMIQGGKSAGPSERDITEMLKADELAEARAGRAPLVEGKLTAAAFMKAGLQIEESQRRILAELAERTVISADRSSEIQEMRFALFRKIKAFVQLQLTYMPGVAEIRDRDEAARKSTELPPKAENVKLYLPSNLGAEERRGACLPAVAQSEAMLRKGQCADALMALRACLHVQAHLIHWRNVNTAGQRAATRSSTLLERIKERRTRAAAKYRAAWTAMQALKGPDFAPEFQKLNDIDINGRVEVENDFVAIRRMREADTSRASRNEPTEKSAKAAVSWIWSVAGGTDKEELHDSVRLDWVKSSERRERWKEEVAILREEMKRVMRSLSAIQREWTAKSLARQTNDPALDSGLSAYALRQVHVHRRIGEGFFRQWSKDAKASVAEIAAADRDLLRELMEGTASEVLEIEEEEEEENPAVAPADDHVAALRYATRAQKARLQLQGGEGSGSGESLDHVDAAAGGEAGGEAGGGEPRG
ncbi:CxC2 domain-containing protein [Mycena chlorophos]|uniref:CxC2 domain-containing protein n=1 Tax=Mycena chlorophos TaxID=658473 RepID=A0A8H6T268_MYCCL|nr:CxC2 domain-containing protein [Mycena chlorophos]